MFVFLTLYLLTNTIHQIAYSIYYNCISALYKILGKQSKTLNNNNAKLPSPDIALLHVYTQTLKSTICKGREKKRRKIMSGLKFTATISHFFGIDICKVQVSSNGPHTFSNIANFLFLIHVIFSRGKAMSIYFTQCTKLGLLFFWFAGDTY